MAKSFCLILFLFCRFASAQNSNCVVNPQSPIFALESAVTLRGTVEINPFFITFAEVNVMTEEQKSVMMLLKPTIPVFLEQWSDTADTLACQSQTVTMVLSEKQREQIMPALLPPFYQLVQVTGTIRWSESSLELAGNAVLMNITKISLEP